MPRTILILSSTPRDMALLHAMEEVRGIEEAIRRSRYRDEHQVVVCLGVRTRDVHCVLLEHRPAIIHYSGYGRSELSLVLEDDNSDSLSVSGADMAGMLVHFRPGIDCMLISSCRSEAQICRRFDNPQCDANLRGCIAVSAFGGNKVVSVEAEHGHRPHREREELRAVGVGDMAWARGVSPRTQGILHQCGG